MLKMEWSKMQDKAAGGAVGAGGVVDGVLTDRTLVGCTTRHS